MYIYTHTQVFVNFILGTENTSTDGDELNFDFGTIVSLKKIVKFLKHELIFSVHQRLKLS